MVVPIKNQMVQIFISLSFLLYFYALNSEKDDAIRQFLDQIIGSHERNSDLSILAYPQTAGKKHLERHAVQVADSLFVCLTYSLIYSLAEKPMIVHKFFPKRGTLFSDIIE